MFKGFTYTTFNVNGIDINPPLAEWQTVVNSVEFEWGVRRGFSRRWYAEPSLSRRVTEGARPVRLPPPHSSLYAVGQAQWTLA